MSVKSLLSFLFLADFPVVRDTDIMVRINLKEARPIRIGIQGTISTSGTDAGLVLFRVR